MRSIAPSSYDMFLGVTGRIRFCYRGEALRVGFESNAEVDEMVVSQTSSASVVRAEGSTEQESEWWCVKEGKSKCGSVIILR